MAPNTMYAKTVNWKVQSMTDKYGKRIDVGQTFKASNGPVVLKYLCPYAILMEHKFYCPFKEEDVRKPSLCPMCRSVVNGTTGVCYTVQELVYFNQEHGIQNILCKEVKEMDKSEIKEARKTPDGNCVTVDDIVEVSLGYMGKQDIYDKLGRRNIFQARIVSFESDCIVFDLSTPFKSNQVDAHYNDIKKMRTLSKEEIKC